MIPKKFKDLSNTLFIFGAGAHANLNMPLGSHLNEKLRKLHLDKSLLKNYRNFLAGQPGSLNIRFKSEQDLLDNLNKLLANASISYTNALVDSPDQYLLNSNEIQSVKGCERFPEIIKFATIYYVLVAEIESLRSTNSSDWYEVFTKMFLETKADIELFFKYSPSIITFNYDTLFERKLISRMLILGYSMEQALDFISNLNIEHVYGSYGQLETDIRNININSPQSLLPLLRHGFNNFKIIGRERSTDTESQKQRIEDNLNKNRIACFMGFGFNYKNCDLLLCSSKTAWKSIKYIISTNIKMKIRDMSKAKSYFAEDNLLFPNDFYFSEDKVNTVDCKEIIDFLEDLYTYNNEDLYNENDITVINHSNYNELEDIEDYDHFDY